MLLLARTIRGIESLVCQEIGGGVRRVRHREVWFDAAAPPRLRLADDVLALVAVARGVHPGRTALRRLARAVLEAPLPGAGRWTGLDVSASFLGRRSYTRYDIEDTVGEALARRLRLPYHSRRAGTAPPPGTMAWRVTIEGEEAAIAMRPAERPLHRRPYKVGSVPGTLHPPLAAAMARLAGPCGLVLDPCCGAGTTLVEAHAVAPGARYLGTDASSEAVRIAARNAAGRGITWAVADGGRLPLADGSVDRVLVNPPWDRQVRGLGVLAGDPGLLWREVDRVLTGAGRVVALLHEPALPEKYGLRVTREIPVSLFGRHPVITVASRG
ncbi:methyltransferase domain-containing protein [Thermoactinospora rubra]|uniref:methyltransferase domain-containing protein n=1 Tax=Thermoactinospora rubra TaxID=1088767 RepID=UPI000A0F9968|nr:methyltransferase domain-containing protein [Thermoactinospora rubra]